MAREVNIIIRAKNLMQRELAKASAALQRFGAQAAQVGKRLAIGFVAAGAAVLAFGIKALRSAEPQERAWSNLRSAFSAYGEDVEAGVKTVTKFSNAMQRQIGIGNEVLELRAAELRQHGVLTKDLESATKATVALERAGMREGIAIRAVAAARQGDFTMLTRYIPALRTATDDAEKAAIVNDFLARKYQEAKDETQTFSGATRVLREEMADAWKEVGLGIAQNEAMRQGVVKLTEWFGKAGKAVKEWLDTGGLQAFVQEFRNRASDMRASAERMAAYIKWYTEVVWGSVIWLGKSMVTVFQNAGRTIKNTWENTTNWLAHHIAKTEARIRGVDFTIPPPDMKNILEGVEEVPKRGHAAAENLAREEARIERDRLARREKIAAAYAATAGEQADAEITEAERIDLAIDESARHRADAEKRLADIESDIARARRRDAQQHISDLQREASEKERIAKMTVRDYIDEQREAEKAAKAAERREKRDAARQAQIERKQSLGVRLTDQDKKFMEARKAILSAREAPQELKAAQKQLDATEGQTRILADLLDEQKSVHTDLQKLLALG